MVDIKSQYSLQMFQPLIRKLQGLIAIEKYRYQKKGVRNVIVAVCLLVGILYGSWYLGSSVWPSTIQNKPMFTVGWSFLIHLWCNFAYFLVYLPGYLGISALHKRYEINPAMTKAWERHDWPEMKVKGVFYMFLNYCIVYPGMIIASMMISGIKVRFDDFPSLSEMVIQLIILMFVQDFFFYWAHRLSHQHKFLYKYHKIHHEYESVFSLVTEYTHPIDYIIGVLIPSSMGFIIMGSRVHCFMLFFWQFWKMFVSTEGHSGYEFPWSPTRIFFFVSGPSYHDWHHSKNVGNYCGSVYLWDYFNDSNGEYMTRFLQGKIATKEE